MTQLVWDEIEQIIKQRGLHERVLTPLVNAAFGYRIRNSSYRAYADVSEQVASRDLKMLVAEGLLAAGGQTRGRAYVASPSVKQIYLRNYEERTNVDPFLQEGAGAS